MTKPKVAIFLSGQPRYLYGKSYNSFKKHLLDKYDCSFFCHYWYDEGKIMCQTDWSAFGIYRPQLTYDNNIENDIKNLYKPIAYQYDLPLEKDSIIQKYKTFNYTTPLSPYNLFSYYKSMRLCANVYEQNKDKNYDFFVKIRYDGIIDAFPDLNNFEYDDKSLIIANLHNHNALDNNTVISKDEYIFLTFMKIHDYFDILSDISIKLNDEEFVYEFCKIKQIPVTKVPTHILYTKIPQNFNYDMS